MAVGSGCATQVDLQACWARRALEEGQTLGLAGTSPEVLQMEAAAYQKHQVAPQGIQDRQEILGGRICSSTGHQGRQKEGSHLVETAHGEESSVAVAVDVADLVTGHPDEAAIVERQ